MGDGNKGLSISINPREQHFNAAGLQVRTLSNRIGHNLSALTPVAKTGVHSHTDRSVFRSFVGFPISSVAHLNLFRP